MTSTHSIQGEDLTSEAKDMTSCPRGASRLKSSRTPSLSLSFTPCYAQLFTTLKATEWRLTRPVINILIQKFSIHLQKPILMNEESVWGLQALLCLWYWWESSLFCVLKPESKQSPGTATLSAGCTVRSLSVKYSAEVQAVECKWYYFWTKIPQMTVQCPYCTAGNDRMHLPPSTVNKTDKRAKAAQLLLLNSSSFF